MRANYYSLGNVRVTRGSTTVTGKGTGWSSISPAPLYFKLSGASTPVYHIESIDSDTQITLTVPYGGANGSHKNYSLCYEVSDNLDLPLVDNNTRNPEEWARKASIMLSNQIRTLYG